MGVGLGLGVDGGSGAWSGTEIPPTLVKFCGRWPSASQRRELSVVCSEEIVRAGVVSRQWFGDWEENTANIKWSGAQAVSWTENSWAATAAQYNSTAQLWAAHCNAGWLKQATLHNSISKDDDYKRKPNNEVFYQFNIKQLSSPKNLEFWRN